MTRVLVVIAAAVVVIMLAPAILLALILAHDTRNRRRHSTSPAPALTCPDCGQPLPPVRLGASTDWDRHDLDMLDRQLRGPW